MYIRFFDINENPALVVDTTRSGLGVRIKQCSNVPTRFQHGMTKFV
mgnify:CR=1 FL=1